MLLLDLDITSAPAELRDGLAQVRQQRPERFKSTDDAQQIRFHKLDDAKRRRLKVESSGRRIDVHYAHPIDVFRALGRLMGTDEHESARNFEETPLFRMLGVMVDVSRNGVLRPQTVQRLLCGMALMGLDTLFLYTEDTYEVEGEPFFGYLRGRYTRAELAALDRYASAFGICMIACLQTLAHFEQVLQWPAYAEYQDVWGILLADDDPKVQHLLEKMIHAASAPFRSNRIHLCMDEAQGLGSGTYKQRHGAHDPFDIFQRHLRRLDRICAALGLRPMIWSDMYFRLGSKKDDYYDPATVIPAAVARAIPSDVQLVYWDYYHHQPEFYEAWIDRHRAMGKEPIMAGGVWTWNRLWAALPWSFAATDACMRACKNRRLQEAFITLWGDDGMECDYFSALPCVQLFAEHGHATEVDGRLLRANLRGSADIDLDDWVRASDVDLPPPLPAASYPPSARMTRPMPNAGKMLLWQDPLLALLDPQFGEPLRPHYEALWPALERAAARNGASRRLLFPSQIAKVVALKCDLRRNLARAYKADDRAALRAIVEGDLSALRREVDILWKRHRALWLDDFKPFGLEVIEQRYGGLCARLQTVNDRVQDYIDGRISEIAELQAELLRISPAPLPELFDVDYGRLKTPSVIK